MKDQSKNMVHPRFKSIHDLLVQVCVSLVLGLKYLISKQGKLFCKAFTYIQGICYNKVHTVT